MATNEIQNGCESSIEAVLASNHKRRCVSIGSGGSVGREGPIIPIGGVAFAAELMLPCINPLSLLCVGIASVTATCIGRTFFGIFPSFNVPAIALVEGPGAPLSVLPWFVAFGVLMGCVAWLTTRG